MLHTPLYDKYRYCLREKQYYLCYVQLFVIVCCMIPLYWRNKTDITNLHVFTRLIMTVQQPI